MNKFADYCTEPTICIYHANCLDGFGAAWAVHDQVCGSLYRDKLIFHPAKHEDPPPDVKGKHVIMVDFCYSREDLDNIAEQAKSILILDHHKTAIEETYGFEIDYPNTEVVLDMNHSGAVLAWQYFSALSNWMTEISSPTPQILLDIEDRDLWKFKRASAKGICAVLQSHPYQFPIWTQLINDPNYEKIWEQGENILRWQRIAIDQIAATCKRVITFDSQYTVPMANTPHVFASEVGNILCRGYPFAVTYYDSSTHRHFSLRSEIKKGLDVSEIAKKFGGGGHIHAAGFSIPLSSLTT